MGRAGGGGGTTPRSADGGRRRWKGFREGTEGAARGRCRGDRGEKGRGKTLRSASVATEQPNSLCAGRAQLQNSRTASALGERSYRTATRTDMDRHGRFFRGQSAEVRGQEEPGGGFRVRGSGWGTRKRERRGVEGRREGGGIIVAGGCRGLRLAWRGGVGCVRRWGGGCRK